ncbi:MAG: DUF3800 domain-containing protein [Deltaproteobacteria bacterium]|nr:MAG: DUF3800 domain-containing protein [Deltaproteobacteria bacterium]
MSKASFVVYIDESGDEGFSFERGSSEWFVLSAVITRKENDLDTVKLVDTVKQKLGRPPKKPLHFRDLKHESRLPFVDEIAKARIRIVSILVHKPSIHEPETYRDRYRLYFFTVRLLLERVSWLCRDHRSKKDAGDGSADIVFSNRSGMSYEELKQYIELLRRRSESEDVRVEWSVVKTQQISAYSPGKRMGLQMADAVASSTFYAVQRSRYGYIEDRYIRMLKPVIYHHRGSYLGYGLKFWPGEVEDLIRTDELLGWVRTEFQ